MAIPSAAPPSAAPVAGGALLSGADAVPPAAAVVAPSAAPTGSGPVAASPPAAVPAAGAPTQALTVTVDLVGTLPTPEAAATGPLIMYMTAAGIERNHQAYVAVAAASAPGGSFAFAKQRIDQLIQETINDASIPAAEKVGEIRILSSLEATPGAPTTPAAANDPGGEFWNAFLQPVYILGDLGNSLIQEGSLWSNGVFGTDPYLYDPHSALFQGVDHAAHYGYGSYGPGQDAVQSYAWTQAGSFLVNSYLYVASGGGYLVYQVAAAGYQSWQTGKTAPVMQQLGGAAFAVTIAVALPASSEPPEPTATADPIPFQDPAVNPTPPPGRANASKRAGWARWRRLWRITPLS